MFMTTEPRSYCLLVLLAVVRQNEIFELHFHLDPLLISQRGPDVMGLGDGRFVRLQDDLGPVVVDMERSEDQDESREGLDIEQVHKRTLFTQGKLMSPHQ